MRFSDIPKFTRHAGWAVDVSWRYLEEHLEQHAGYNLNLDPDFQRAHVWTEPQQVRYVEFILRGGQSSRDILTNCVNWQSSLNNIGPYELVDGKQRLAAVLRFLRNEIAIFGGNYHKDFT